MSLRPSAVSGRRRAGSDASSAGAGLEGRGGNEGSRMRMAGSVAGGTWPRRMRRGGSWSALVVRVVHVKV